MRHGWPVSTYSSHENGQTEDIPQDAAAEYAKAFRVSKAWLLTGEGPQAAQNVVRVMGFIGAGAEISPEYEQVPEEGLKEISLSVAISEDAIAFEVQGASMLPVYKPGMAVIVSLIERDPISMIGKEVAVRTSDDRRYLKTLRVGSKRGHFHLESLNAELIENVKIAWVGEVIAMIPSGRWTEIESPAPARAPAKRQAGRR